MAAACSETACHRTKLAGRRPLAAQAVGGAAPGDASDGEKGSQVPGPGLAVSIVTVLTVCHSWVPEDPARGCTYSPCSIVPPKSQGFKRVQELDESPAALWQRASGTNFDVLCLE